MRLILPLLLLLAFVTDAFASNEYMLTFRSSKKYAVRYFADHELSTKDTAKEYAVVVVHGVDGGTTDCSRPLRDIVKNHSLEEKVFFVAPCFPVANMLDTDEKKRIAYWDDGNWQPGGDSPVIHNLSTYDVLDAVFNVLNNKQLYPNLKHVLFCGFSAGGQVVSRYMAVTRIKARKGLTFDFAAGGPSTWLFFDRRAGWHCGLATRNRYTASLSDKAMLKNVKSRFMLCFCGKDDTELKNLSVGLAANEQGANRYERFCNFKRHVGSLREIKHSFEFIDVEGEGHSWGCWYKIDIIRSICGQRVNSALKDQLRVRPY